MKIYTESVYVGNYEIEAFGDTPEAVIRALVSAYRKNFGSFAENGFRNKDEWLDYHGISADSIHAVTLNTAVVR